MSLHRVFRSRHRADVAHNSADVRAVEICGGLALFLLIIWPKYAFFAIGPLPTFNPFTITTIVASAGILVVLFVRPSVARRLWLVWSRNRVLISTLVTWFVVQFFADLVGNDPEASLHNTLHYLTNQGAYFAIAAMITSSDRGEERLAKIIIIGTTVVLLVALYEIVTESVFMSNFREMFEKGLDPGLLNSKLLEKTRNGAFRVQSLLGHPIVLAQYLAAVTPFMIVAAAQARRPLWKVFLIAMVFLGGVTILETGSRGGLLAVFFSIGIAFVTYQYRNSAKFAPFLVILTLGLLLLTAAIFYSDIESVIVGRTPAEYASSYARSVMWSKSYPFITSSPLLGYGDGQSLSMGGLYNEATGALSVDDYFLSIILDFGALGLLSFGLFVAATARSLFSGALHFDKKRSGHCVALLSIVLSIVFVMKVLSLPDNVVFLYVAAGAVSGFRAQRYARRSAVESGGVASRSRWRRGMPLRRG